MVSPGLDLNSDAKEDVEGCGGASKPRTKAFYHPFTCIPAPANLRRGQYGSHGEILALKSCHPTCDALPRRMQAMAYSIETPSP